MFKKFFVHLVLGSLEPNTHKDSSPNSSLTATIPATKERNITPTIAPTETATAVPTITPTPKPLEDRT